MVPSEEREPPKVFGREMERYSVNGWLLNIATLTLTVYPSATGGYRVEVMTGNYTHRDNRETLESSIEWLETTARRIMRECFEVAGPMVAVEQMVLGDPSYEKRCPVRFRDA